jgi:hypothetical protein
VEGSGAPPVRQPGRRSSHSEGPLSLTDVNDRDEVTVQIGRHGFLSWETDKGWDEVSVEIGRR